MRFESTIERLGRIIARQYNIDVRFEGNAAYTDGKTIVLPQITNMTEELKKLFHGFLDHEVGHCRHTEMKEVTDVSNLFHRHLLNATEDVRIEREMICDYPGSEFNLGILNDTLHQKIDEKWEETAPALRLISDIRNMMAGRDHHGDDDIQHYLEAVREDVEALNDCNNTTELKSSTSQIVEKIRRMREEEKKEKFDSDEEGESEGSGGEGGSGGPGDGKMEQPVMPGDEQEKPDPGESGDDSDGSGDPDSDSEGSESDSEGSDESDEGEGSDDGSEGSEDGSEGSDGGGSSRPDSSFDDMMDASTSSSEETGFEDAITDIEGMMQEAVGNHLSEDETSETPGINYCNEFKDQPHVPITTKFDTVTDRTKSGTSSEYAALVREVMPHVRPIRQALEKVLLVKSKAKWKGDQERGQIDLKNMARLVTDRNFRKPFKTMKRTDVSDVAVEMLMDLSGSMGGRKIQLAKESVIAIGEALKALGISFEVTGWTTDGSGDIQRYARDIGDTERFNRVEEILKYFVFKSFNTERMIGIATANSMANNTDGEAVRWAAKRLAERKEKRKILMVFSDGYPVDYGDRAILNKDLELAVKEITMAGIETIGVGIMSDAVERFYPDSIVVNDLEELPRQAMSKMAKIIEAGIDAA